MCQSMQNMFQAATLKYCHILYVDLEFINVIVYFRTGLHFVCLCLGIMMTPS